MKYWLLGLPRSVLIPLETIVPEDVGGVAVRVNDAGPPPPSVGDPRGDPVVVHVEILQRVGAIRPAASMIIRPGDALPVVLEDVAIDLDIGRVDNFDSGAGRPVRKWLGRAVAACGVPPDRRVVAELVEDASALVVLDGVVLVQRMDVVNVGPQARTAIVMRVVPSDRQPIGEDEFRAARAPVGEEARIVVVRDFIVLDSGVVAGAYDAESAVVMDGGLVTRESSPVPTPA